jgi:hypothetical protein
MRYNFSHFGNLPILARIFWKIPKYLQYNLGKESFNKIVGINCQEFKATCIFSHKTNGSENNFNIKSDFVFISEKYKIEEMCNYLKNDTNEKFMLNYSFKDKILEEQIFFFEKEIGYLPINIQNSILYVENLLEKNKDKCVVN